MPKHREGPIRIGRHGMKAIAARKAARKKAAAPPKSAGKAKKLPVQPVQKVPNADDFRAELASRFRKAERRGWASLQIYAWEMHRDIGGYPAPNHAMATCSDVMTKEIRVRDEVRSRPQKGRGASLTIVYSLPRSEADLPLPASASPLQVPPYQPDQIDSRNRVL